MVVVWVHVIIIQKLTVRIFSKLLRSKNTVNSLLSAKIFVTFDQRRGQAPLFLSVGFLVTFITRSISVTTIHRDIISICNCSLESPLSSHR
jgi:hypothetical protein